jgi:hypothetical protein
VLLTIVGVQFVMFGVMSDILAKLYYRQDPLYSIERELTATDDGAAGREHTAAN